MIVQIDARNRHFNGFGSRKGHLFEAQHLLKFVGIAMLESAARGANIYVGDERETTRNGILGGKFDLIVDSSVDDLFIGESQKGDERVEGECRAGNLLAGGPVLSIVEK